MNEELTLQLQDEEELTLSLADESSLDITLETAATAGDNNYNNLYNKPLINDVVLVGNRSLDDLNIQVKGDYPDEALTNQEIEDLLENFS
jgi:hemolysin activation/secretion protein